MRLRKSALRWPRDAASNLRDIDGNCFLRVRHLTFLAPKALGFFQRGKMSVNLSKIRQRACREPALGEMNECLRRSKRSDETLPAGGIIGSPQHVLYGRQRLQVRAGAAFAEQGGEKVDSIAQALGIDAHLMARARIENGKRHGIVQQAKVAAPDFA